MLYTPANWRRAKKRKRQARFHSPTPLRPPKQLAEGVWGSTGTQFVAILNQARLSNGASMRAVDESDRQLTAKALEPGLQVMYPV